jgi:aldose 1-epimerase
MFDDHLWQIISMQRAPVVTFVLLRTKVVLPILFSILLASSQGAAATPPSPAGGSIRKSGFGSVAGEPVSLYTLMNAKGAVVKITNYGATLTEVHVPDRTGALGDVVLGFDRIEPYARKRTFFGATVGRVANRIKGASFALDGKTYTLNANDGPNQLHGGPRGWDTVIWSAEPQATREGPSLKLRYVSPDGEENYPGTVHATVTYTLTDANELRVRMEATTDKTTVVSMVHHSCWNLAGQGTILDHILEIPAKRYTPGDPIPDGTVTPVKGTPFDFTAPKPIGKDLAAAGGQPAGFDHNWIIDGNPHALRLVASVKDPKSGRRMTIRSDQPALQFYSGKFLDGSSVGKGVAQVRYGCLALESQKIPNSINVPQWRSEVILKPGQTYVHTMVHTFTVE